MRVAFGVAVLSLAVGCSGDSERQERGPVTPLDPATTGTISGVVRFAGAPPPETQLKVAGDATCAAAHPGPVPAGDVLVENGRLENAFVYIRSGLGGRVFAVPESPVTIDQRGCIYVPHVVGAQAGQPIEFVNSDPTLHNVHTTPEKSRPSNFGMSMKGSRRAIRIDHPEVMVRVRCDVHPWMQAFVGILDHPYFALTGKDGSFRLENIPAGEYTLAAWHERFGSREAKVTVTAKGAAEVSFEYRAG